jgi:hypothetical protein
MTVGLVAAEDPDWCELIYFMMANKYLYFKNFNELISFNWFRISGKITKDAQHALVNIWENEDFMIS